MSKASTPIKVLRTALKRVDNGWTQGNWLTFNKALRRAFVCLEGALFGFCDSNKHGLTDAQKKARDTVLEIIGERYPGYSEIPTWNDAPGRTKEEVMEVIKLAIIRLETTGDGEVEDDEIIDILEWAENN